jgi:hypothetical protein
MKDPVKDRLERYGLLAAIGPDHFFPTINTAVDRYVEETGAEWVDRQEAPDVAFGEPARVGS